MHCFLLTLGLTGSQSWEEHHWSNCYLSSAIDFQWTSAALSAHPKTQPFRKDEQKGEDIKSKQEILRCCFSATKLTNPSKWMAFFVEMFGPSKAFTPKKIGGSATQRCSAPWRRMPIASPSPGWKQNLTENEMWLFRKKKKKKTSGGLPKAWFSFTSLASELVPTLTKTYQKGVNKKRTS